MHNRGRLLRGTDGFTLMELLAALAILALMASMAVPAYSRFMANLQLDVACRSLITEIRYGQQAAMTEFTRWRLTYYHAGFRLDALDRQANKYVPRRDLVALPPGVRYLGLPVPHSMNFTEAGGVSVTNSDLWTIGFINQYGVIRYVIITPVTGRAIISDTPPR